MNSVRLVVGIAGLSAAVAWCFRIWQPRYLHWSYPIHSSVHAQPIPTCPYQWPNGQGDVAKFLEGEANSDEWRARHGRVYRIWSGTTQEIVLTHPDDVREVFRDSDRHEKAVNNNSGWLMGKLLGRCVGLVSGTTWQQLRAATGAPFTHKSSATYTDDIHRAVEQHFQEMKEKMQLQHGLLNPVDDLRMLPFCIIARILYGDMTLEQGSELLHLTHLRETLFTRMIQGGMTRFSWSRFLPLQTNSDLLQFKRRWAEFNSDIYPQCQAANREVAIVPMYEAVERGSIDTEQLLQTLDEMLFANLDVTLGGLSWNLLFLAAHPDVQSEIRTEARRARQGGNTQVWKSYLASSTTLLAASVLESARLKPLAAFSVPQAAPTARRVGDFVVPPQTNFIVDTRALNMLNSFWGDDAGEYRPARFLGGKASDLRYQYWRFGFGPRQCMGKYVVDILIHAILAHLVLRYRISLDHTSSWDRKQDIWIAHPDTKIRCESLERGV
ncbi:cytochrome P450 [Karstenula rhodostoma CBS 690.94]|uniref:Cytochrome P450 n=1 Tax=Karstenula rhodostoma CBS 690.94 TaxID=1392251 RepID=A0A9P4PMH1_9PLEO|nr:cytochrome P450 [Karstenula rhodostoma CBS 690.94]